MLSRIFHYSVDAVLLSTVLAGVKRTSGLAPDLTQIPEGTPRDLTGKFLGFGEFTFDSLMAAAHASRSTSSERNEIL
ncbi:unnamed protein product [Tilletia controversa]|uniref:DUF1748-domain-containing protein n=2 Tax=Tilletia TaxID=13289 RepID=A0A8X7T0E9_9BASI|nr:hypothetical protein CF328_g1774 [Tilletia controversa]KAE8208786.1 hypothetical protein CF335_g167 [Tilletia laevis]CAD6888818.1 unnamed protein product [Tilletia caries]KAE8255233.1 hypothetical protein A4X06_0g517 [Tilletia controversa]CAD6915747.1 unnamed protein product [Tilletia controversa]